MWSWLLPGHAVSTQSQAEPSSFCWQALLDFRERFEYTCDALLFFSILLMIGSSFSALFDLGFVSAEPMCNTSSSSYVEKAVFVLGMGLEE